MTFQEFQNKDLSLVSQITDYKISITESEADIAACKREICKLEQQRRELNREYALENYDKTTDWI